MKTPKEIIDSLVMMKRENEELSKDLLIPNLSSMAKHLIVKDIKERENCIETLEWVTEGKENGICKCLLNGHNTPIGIKLFKCNYIPNENCGKCFRQTIMKFDC